MPDWRRFVAERLDLEGFRPETAERVVRELADQLADFYREGLRRGLSESQAAGFARAQVTSWKELSRAVQAALPAGALPRLDRLAEQSARAAEERQGAAARLAEASRDLLQAARSLRRHRAFSLTAAATLALGIGATTSIFSVVHGIVIQPLPYPESDRLVRIWHSAPGADIARIATSWGVYHHYRERARSFDRFVGSVRSRATLTTRGRATQVLTARVTHDFFDVFLEGPPAAGRLFDADDGAPGAPAVALISYRLWQTRFGGEPGTVGGPLTIDGRSYEIVGVLPASFDAPSKETDVWSCFQVDVPNLRIGNFSTATVGRLADGVTPDEALRELRSLIPELQEPFPGPAFDMIVTRGQLRAELTPLKEEVIGDVADMLWLLLVSVGLVFLVAGANVVSLFLVRAESRGREMAIRTALGAGTARVVRHYLAESLLLAVAGGMLGVLLAGLAVQALVDFGPARLPRLHEVGLSIPVLAFSLLLTLGAALLVGAAPVLGRRLAEPDMLLADGGRGATASRGRIRLRRLLVVSEVALALVLMVAAGLMLRTLWKLQAVDPGFNPDRTVTFRLALPPDKYPDADRVRSFLRELVDELAGLPGVRTVGAVTCLPLTGCGNINPLYEQGEPVGAGTPPAVRIRLTLPGYFETMQIPLLAGRLPDWRDVEQDSGAAVVSRTLAERFWPGQDPIGRRVYPDLPSEGTRWNTVVGVVGDVLSGALHEPPSELIYLASLDVFGSSVRSLVFVVRTGSSTAGLRHIIQERVSEQDPQLPVIGFEELDDIVAEARAPTLFAMALLSIAGLVAVALGTVGVYGMLSYLVSLRRGEIGIRMALGASRGDVNRMILRQGARVAVFGVAAGVVGALALSRLMLGLLVDVSPSDPVTYVAVALVVGAVIVIASWIPARRAAAVEPVAALRGE